MNCIDSLQLFIKVVIQFSLNYTGGVSGLVFGVLIELFESL